MGRPAAFCLISLKAFLSHVLSVFNLFEYLIPKRYFDAKKRQTNAKQAYF